MSLRVCTRLCGQCPFSKKSIKGWLGGLSIEDTIDHINHEVVFSCHKVRGEDPQENLHKALKGEQHICRGFMLSAKLSCKMFGSRGTVDSELLKELADSMGEITDLERENVMATWDFRKHHTL